jgi:hypothetical protein
MKLETKTRGIGLPGMEALSFTMSVAHGGIGVPTTGCGGKHCFLFFYPLFRFASVFLFFCSLSSLSLFLSFPVCSPLSTFFSCCLFFFLRSPFLCFLFLTFPLSLFFFSSPLFGSSSGFYSQRMQAFFGNGWRTSQWRGMSVARRASWLKRLHYRY